MDLEAIDEKIQNMQNQVDYEKMMPPTNCATLARMEIELAGLYNRKGEKDRANQLLEDARNILSDSMCPDSREKRKVQSQLNFIFGTSQNPNIQVRASIPAYVRFAGLIILMVGYGILYLLNYTGILTNTEYFNIAIFAVFGVSLVAGSMIQRAYVRKIRTR